MKELSCRFLGIGDSDRIKPDWDIVEALALGFVDFLSEVAGLVGPPRELVTFEGAFFIIYAVMKLNIKFKL